MNNYTPDVPKKQCTKCGEWKPCTTEYWYRQKAGRYGFNSRCKVCTARYDALLHNQERRRNHAAKPENKERERLRRLLPENLEKERLRNNTPDRKEYRKQYQQSERGQIVRRRHKEKPEAHEYDRRYAANRRLDPEKRASDRAREKLYRQTPEGKIKNRIKSHNRRAKEKNLPNGFTYQEWQTCLDYWGHKCCICGRSADFWHIIAQEHWIPINASRHDNPGSVKNNIVPMCHSMRGVLPEDTGCNNNKCDKDPIAWLYDRYGKRKGNEILKRIEMYFQWLNEGDE